MSQDAQHLIEKFWDGTATAVEKQQLAILLGPDEAAWQTRLRNEYTQALEQTGSPLSQEQSARVLRRLHWQLAFSDAPAVPRAAGWMRWAAAAVLVLVSSLVLLLLHWSAPPAPVARAASRPVSAPQLVRRTNPGPGPLRLPLPDGSVVTLQPSSSLSYYAPFGQASRELSLRGTALFAVAKDAAHPFTVVANGFTTTALGTKFRVQATEMHRMTVRLLEGKVVVRATPASHLTIRDQYLMPGQELTVNTQTHQARLHSFAPAPRSPLVVVVPTDLTFEKDNLATVFAQVGERYHVRFAYDRAAVRGLSFSGTFAATDPLPVVLRAVCTPNNLSFTQAARRVTIRKSP